MSAKRNLRRAMLSFIVLAVLIAGFSPAVSAEEAEPGSMPAVVSLRTNGGAPAGTVTVWNDSNFVYVRLDSTDGWEILKTQMAAALSLEGIPQSGGNPVPGLFPYQSAHNPYTISHTYEVNLADAGFQPGSSILIAACADMRKAVSGDVYEEAAAWGGDLDFPGEDCTKYFAYTVILPCTPPPPPVCRQETAWGEGNSIGANGNWAMFFTFAGEGKTVNLVAGRDMEIVGDIRVYKGNEALQVIVTTSSGWTMTEGHLYAGGAIPSKSAPGRFPYKTEDLGKVTQYMYSIPLNELPDFGAENPLYLAVHASVEQ